MKGILSKFYWGVDYQQILKEEMEMLVKEIEKVRTVYISEIIYK